MGMSTDLLTTIYTGCPKSGQGVYSYATPGSTVTLSGFQGAFSAMNQTYINGVSALNNGTVPNPNPKFVDSGKHGSFQDLFMSFLLNFDSRSFQSMADANGLIQIPQGASISVTHLVTSSMQYPDFVAACLAWFYAVYRVGTTKLMQYTLHRPVLWF